MKILDETDSFIIEELKKDARTSFRKIARKLGLSPDTVINRYEFLRKKGVIRGSTVVIDPKKIGYEAMAAFMIDTSPTHIFGTESIHADSTSILKSLIKMRSVILATKTVGDRDLLAIAVVKNFKHLIDLSANISEIPGVKDFQVSFWTLEKELSPEYFII